MSRCFIVVSFTLAIALFPGPGRTEPFFESEVVFDPASGEHGHVHASCIVECPNGDLRVIWYENGKPLPEPHFNRQRDKSDDVRIGGARKPQGASNWEAPFVMADSFGVSDNNPCMAIDHSGRLWMIRATLLAVPDWSWGSSLLRYSISSDYQKAGRPTWQKEDVLIPHPQGIEPLIEKALAALDVDGRSPERVETIRKRTNEMLKNPIYSRLGWMPRAHPFIRSDGTVIIPLSNENFNIAVMAMTSDSGETWKLSQPVPEAGLTQPTLVEFPDGRISAFFRNGDARRRIKRSDSRDGGMTWSEVTVTTLPHPGAGIEAIRLKNGHLAMVYNDKEVDPRDRLAISISTDEGATWQWTRRIIDEPNARFDYPSVIQARDGSLHVTFSDKLATIKHVRFNEEWIQQAH